MIPFSKFTSSINHFVKSIFLILFLNSIANAQELKRLDWNLREIMGDFVIATDMIQVTDGSTVISYIRSNTEMGFNKKCGIVKLDNYNNIQFNIQYLDNAPDIKSVITYKIEYYNGYIFCLQGVLNQENTIIAVRLLQIDYTSGNLINHWNFQTRDFMSGYSEFKIVDFILAPLIQREVANPKIYILGLKQGLGDPNSGLPKSQILVFKKKLDALEFDVYQITDLTNPEAIFNPLEIKPSFLANDLNIGDHFEIIGTIRDNESSTRSYGLNIWNKQFDINDVDGEKFSVANENVEKNHMAYYDGVWMNFGSFFYVNPDNLRETREGVFVTWDSKVYTFKCDYGDYGFINCDRHINIYESRPFVFSGYIAGRYNIRDQAYCLSTIEPDKLGANPLITRSYRADVSDFADNLINNIPFITSYSDKRSKAILPKDTYTFEGLNKEYLFNDFLASNCERDISFNKEELDFQTEPLNGLQISQIDPIIANTSDQIEVIDGVNFTLTEICEDPQNRITKARNEKKTIRPELTVMAIYPNPFSDDFRIRSDQGIYRVIITDVAGKVRFQKEYDLIPKSIDVKATNFPSGVYFINITSPTGERLNFMGLKY